MNAGWEVYESEAHAEYRTLVCISHCGLDFVVNVFGTIQQNWLDWWSFVIRAPVRGASASIHGR